ncbi:MAG: hypothetical protein PHS54_01270 [Clostridia bacterium]|nr:hypothetical protein [Clostridia bacterium]
MNFILTNSSSRALKQIKEKMIEQFEKKDINKFRLKFTKKKEFLAIPVPYTGPAFQLFINGRFHKTYFFKDKKWKEL